MTVPQVNSWSGFKLGGFQPLSLNDYPGRVAAVIFTQGCNFRCPFCHNAGLLPFAPEGPASPLEAVPTPAAVLADLTRRRRLLDGVVVSGGEPTLQPDLVVFLAALRALGLHIKLDTNGSRPEVLQALFEQRLTDMVAMDIKAPWSRYDVLSGCAAPLDALQRSVRLIAASGLPHQFRTTVVEALLSPADLAAIRAMVPAGSPYRLQPFVPHACLDPGLAVG